MGKISREMSREEPRYVSGVSDVDRPPSLSVAGDQAPLAADISPTGRYAVSPDDLQRQIHDVEQQIEALSASKSLARSGMGSHSLPVGGLANDDFVSRPSVSVGKTRGFSAGFETPRRTRKLPEIPVKVSDGSVGEFVTLMQPGQLGVSRGDPKAASVVATPAAVPPKSDGDRRVHPTIKLPAFDGKMSLESFLAKLQNCSDYYNWTEGKRICHLKARLHRYCGKLRETQPRNRL